MLQNARVTAFTVSELLRENQEGGVGVAPLPSPFSPHPPSKVRIKFKFSAELNKNTFSF